MVAKRKGIRRYITSENTQQKNKRKKIITLLYNMHAKSQH